MSLSAVGFAQNSPDSTGRSKPLISQETKQEVRQTASQAGEQLDQQLGKSLRYQERNQLNWFQPGNVFVGGGLGFGIANKQFFTAINTRVGYFFQPGFVAGLRYDYDQLLAKSYHARQLGLFARYYPFRTRISSFVGASLNGGREFSKDIAADDKARYTSVGLEIGVMAWVLHRLGAELAYEGNFYNRLNPAASLGRGGRLKLGVNYYFGRFGSQGKFRRAR